jgi:hypothetical protein
MPPYAKEPFTFALTQTLQFGSSFAGILADKLILLVEENLSDVVVYRRNILVRPEQVPAWLVDFVVPANPGRHATDGLNASRAAFYPTEQGILQASR